MPATDAAVRTLVHEVQSLAEAAARIAQEMQEYAEVLATDASLALRLSSEYGAGGAVVQIMQEVEHRTRRPDLDKFQRAVTDALATAQRTAR